MTVRFGNSEYRLVCRREARGITLDGTPVLGETIHMQDDGKAHEAVFPPRERQAMEKKSQMITFHRYFCVDERTKTCYHNYKFFRRR